MKKIVYIFSAILLSLTSCSDFLERGPKDELSPSSFWSKEADATLAVVGCYSFMEVNSTPIYFDAISDNAFSFHRFAGWQVIGNGSMSPGEAQMKNFMDFKGIHACNEYLEKEKEIEFTTPGLRERYQAEVRFIRAYSYFTKTQAYGDVPESTSPDYPGSANNATHSGYNFKKFYNSLSQFPLTYENTAKSIPLFRYAEVLLTIAECKIELNQIDEEVYSILNDIRTRSGMPEVDRTKYNSPASLRELVRRERRVELAGEGLRRADIIRWGIVNQVMNQDALGCNQGIILSEVSDPVFGDLKVKLDKEPFFVEKRSYKEHNRLLPIPLTEMDKNPNLAPNNPGYE